MWQNASCLCDPFSNLNKIHSGYHTMYKVVEPWVTSLSCLPAHTLVSQTVYFNLFSLCFIFQARKIKSATSQKEQHHRNCLDVVFIYPWLTPVLSSPPLSLLHNKKDKTGKKSPWSHLMGNCLFWEFFMKRKFISEISNNSSNVYFPCYSFRWCCRGKKKTTTTTIHSECILNTITNGTHP